MGIMDQFFNTAKDVANVAAKKAGETAQVGKLKFECVKYNNQIEESYQKIGNLVYDARKSGVDHDEMIEQCVREIDAVRAKIQKINEQINDLKQTVTCPNCLFSNPEDAAFCAKCGMKLSPKSQSQQEPTASDGVYDEFEFDQE